MFWWRAVGKKSGIIFVSQLGNKGEIMSPAVGVMIVITFMLINFSVGMAVLYRTIKEGKQH